MTGRTAGSAAQTIVADGCSPARAPGMGGSRPLRRAPGATGPIDVFRSRGVAFKRSFRRAPLAGIGRSLPGEVTSWTT
jgi:hypothetical protein